MTGIAEHEAQATSRLQRRAVTAAMIGNATEWYDYATYGYLAIVLGKVFFPASNPTLSLLASFATFAVAFGIRPVGAFLLGPLNDKIGRKRTLSITILTMAAATCTIGLLPGYDTIGVLAPVALVLARLVQGFAVGGEYGGASTFVVEYAPDARRGFWASWLECGAIGGFLLASGLVTCHLHPAGSGHELVGMAGPVPHRVAPRRDRPVSEVAVDGHAELHRTS